MNVYKRAQRYSSTHSWHYKEVKGQLHAQAASCPGKNAGTHWVWSCVGPRAGSDVLEKRKIFVPTGVRNPNRLSRRLITQNRHIHYFWRSCDRASWMYSFKYNQQDATLYNILYYCQCSTCFRRFLRPSSGAQKLYTQHLVYVKLACCYRYTRCCVYSFWAPDDGRRNRLKHVEHWQ